MLTALPEFCDCVSRSPYYLVGQHRHGRKRISGVEVAAESLEQLDEALKTIIDGANFVTERRSQWHRSFQDVASIAVTVSWVRNQMRTSDVNSSVKAFTKIFNESDELRERIGKRVVGLTGLVIKTNAYSGRFLVHILFLVFGVCHRFEASVARAC